MTTTRQSKAGLVRYLHLAHNEWDAAKGGRSRGSCSASGREDELDKEAVRRLVTSLSRLLDPGDALAAAAEPGEGLTFTGSRPYGGAWVLDRLWQRLGTGTILTGLASSGRGTPAAGS